MSEQNISEFDLVKIIDFLRQNGFAVVTDCKNCGGSGHLECTAPYGLCNRFSFKNEYDPHVCTPDICQDCNDRQRLLLLAGKVASVERKLNELMPVQVIAPDCVIKMENWQGSADGYYQSYVFEIVPQKYGYGFVIEEDIDLIAKAIIEKANAVKWEKFVLNFSKMDASQLISSFAIQLFKSILKDNKKYFELFMKWEIITNLSFQKDNVKMWRDMAINQLDLS